MHEVGPRAFLSALYPGLAAEPGGSSSAGSPSPPGPLSRTPLTPTRERGSSNGETAESEGPRIVVWTLPDRASHWLSTPGDAGRLARRLAASRDVYFGVALQDRRRALEIAGRKRRGAVDPSRVRGFEASAAAIPGVWIDLDVAGPGHRQAGLPPTPDAALRLLDAVPPEPSIVVATGGGLHVYWLFKEPWTLESAGERAAARQLVTRVQHAVARRAAEQGWRVDATADLARVLRLPGTFNHKTGAPRPVRALSFQPERRVEPAAFDLLPEPPPAVGAPPAASAGLDAGPPADFRSVYAGCSFLRHCHEHRATLSEPEWYAALSIVGRCATPEADGRALAHAMSRGYPRYTPAETDAKLSQALAAASARTCRSIGRDLGAWADHCRRCPNRGVKSPILLGRSPLSQNPSRAGGSDLPLSRAGVRGVWERGPGGEGSRSGDRGGLPDRPEIVVSHREDLVCDQALAALAAREPNLFRRGGVLVQVVPPEDAGGDPEPLHRPPAGPRLREVSEPRLRELLAEHCAFSKPRRTKEGEDLVPAHPPAWAVRELLGRHAWPELPRIEGIVEGPVLRGDGSVLQRPGYDPRSGLYCAPSAAFERVDERATRDHAEDALALLMEAVCDFPFAEEAHFSAWLASLLTPLARYAFRGPAPLFVIDANVRGAGKSLLADVSHLIVTGRPAPRTPWARDESELRKSITAIALSGAQMVLIDNVSGALGSATLDLVLTGATWSDRLLGGNTRLELPLTATWTVTGNNLVLGGDTPRRALHVRLESPEEKPEERTGFTHADLPAWVAAERGRLLPAALTLLAAYRADGSPPQELLPMGSYEGWSELVRATLVWLKLPDPARTREALPTTAEAETGTLKSLILGLEEVLQGLGGAATAKEVLKQLKANPARFETLRSAVEDLFPRLKDDELPTPRQLGMKLRSVHGRVVAGAAVVQAPRSPRGARWSVRRAANDAAEEAA